MLGLGNTLVKSGGLISAFNNYSLTFDGTDDYVDCGSISEVAVTNNVTVSLWVQAPNIASFDCFFSRQVDSDNLIKVWWYNNKIAMEVWEGGTKFNSLASWTPDSDWHHFVWSWDTSGTPEEAKNALYLDDVPQTLTSGAGWGNKSCTTDFLIGTGLYSDYFNGLIDEVAIWDVGLDAEAVSSIYNSGSPINLIKASGDYDNEGDLVSWWRMGDGTEAGEGDTIYDMSDNDNDGTKSGAVYSTTVP